MRIGKAGSGVAPFICACAQPLWAFWSTRVRAAVPLLPSPFLFSAFRFCHHFVLQLRLFAVVFIPPCSVRAS